MTTIQDENYKSAEISIATVRKLLDEFVQFHTAKSSEAWEEIDSAVENEALCSSLIIDDSKGEYLGELAKLANHLFVEIEAFFHFIHEVANSVDEELDQQ